VKQVKLGDLLPHSTLTLIYAEHHRGTLTIAKLKDYTRMHRAELLTKGVDADYLAYLLAHMLGVSR
jgi:hypothetical protein